MMYAGFALLLFSILLRLFGAEVLPLILGIVGFILAIFGIPVKSSVPEKDPWEDDEDGADYDGTEYGSAEYDNESVQDNGSARHDGTQTNIDI